MVLDVVGGMPQGGGYSVSGAASSALKGAVRMQTGSGLRLDPAAARPSFCSGATYLVFLRAMQELVPGKFRDEKLAGALCIRGQPDGTGVWGRWNANGPGTALLFLQAGLGRNFVELEKAEPGDFLKIFWADGVGAREKGHSVVYLGRRGGGAAEEIQFWSSNQPGGYGSKWVPRSRVHRFLFSRLEVPENIDRVLGLGGPDAYLARLASGSSDWVELEVKVWGRGQR